MPFRMVEMVQYALGWLWKRLIILLMKYKSSRGFGGERGA